MGVSKTEAVYVTYTCKKCGSAFIDIDPNDDINETPLKTRYCPDCVAKGYKNPRLTKTLSKDKKREKFIEENLKENNIFDKKDISFIKKYIKKQINFKESNKQIVNISNIFKNAVEVLGYQSWKQ